MVPPFNSKHIQIAQVQKTLNIAYCMDHYYTTVIFWNCENLVHFKVKLTIHKKLWSHQTVKYKYTRCTLVCDFWGKLCDDAVKITQVWNVKFIRTPLTSPAWPLLKAAAGEQAWAARHESGMSPSEPEQKDIYQTRTHNRTAQKLPVTFHLTLAKGLTCLAASFEVPTTLPLSSSTLMPSDSSVWRISKTLHTLALAKWRESCS